MRAIYTVAFGAIVFGFGGLIACSKGGDSAAADQSNLTSNGTVVSPDEASVRAAIAKLHGAWRNNAGGDPLAIILAATEFVPGPGLQATRTVKHVAQAKTDTADVDTDGPVVRVKSTASPTSGVVDFSNQRGFNDFVDTTVETYRYEITTVPGGESLTLTQTDEVVIHTPAPIFGVDVGSPTTTTKPVRPPITLTRSDSWCMAHGPDSIDVEGGCFVEHRDGIWKPADMPPECKDHELACMQCLPDHSCRMRKVSTCELDFKVCEDSAATCETQREREEQKGQVSKVGEKGQPISCDGSPSGKAVCCERFPEIRL